ncbi:hypothetical protein SmJEL517_g03767 [Synchytrium microbalum]|uniref:Uncharacterized protein n=1 Tax=Synchytrium microbalum TaxID=1806994 RepID=A0A507C105_9FUNG|nr:uncharacterized protein SmJEL517_g03767 [Synchytrium microbalum]TPX33382.1 hypothetical protein SmJEL517_g03767 [Synchytrium microbalum]
MFPFQLRAYEESDEFCPHCDNHYVINAKTPSMGIGVEGDDPRLVKDMRAKVAQFNEPDLMADRLEYWNEIAHRKSFAFWEQAHADV